MRHRRRNVAQQNQYINSDFINFQLSIFILLLVLFGGSGSLYGPLIGAVLLTLIDATLARWPAVQHFAYGGLLLFSLYAMPNEWRVFSVSSSQDDALMETSPPSSNPG